MDEVLFVAKAPGRVRASAAWPPPMLRPSARQSAGYGLASRKNRRRFSPARTLSPLSHRRRAGPSRVTRQGVINVSVKEGAAFLRYYLAGDLDLIPGAVNAVEP